MILKYSPRNSIPPPCWRVTSSAPRPGVSSIPAWCTDCKSRQDQSLLQKWITTCCSVRWNGYSLRHRPLLRWGRCWCGSCPIHATGPCEGKELCCCGVCPTWGGGTKQGVLPSLWGFRCSTWLISRSKDIPPAGASSHGEGKKSLMVALSNGFGEYGSGVNWESAVLSGSLDSRLSHSCLGSPAWVCQRCLLLSSCHFFIKAIGEIPLVSLRNSHLTDLCSRGTYAIQDLFLHYFFFKQILLFSLTLRQEWVIFVSHPNSEASSKNTIQLLLCTASVTDPLTIIMVALVLLSSTNTEYEPIILYPS